MQVFSALLFTIIMSYAYGNTATISYQFYIMGTNHLELPTVIGGLIARFITKLELNAYES